MNNVSENRENKPSKSN